MPTLTVVEKPISFCIQAAHTLSAIFNIIIIFPLLPRLMPSLILLTFPEQCPTEISVIICSHGKALIASASVSVTFSVLALLMLTLSSLKMSQLKLIPCFSSLANHTKSFHCFIFILFVEFMVQPFESFPKTTPKAFPPFLQTAHFTFLFMVPPSPVSTQCNRKPPTIVPPKRIWNLTNLQVFHRFDTFSGNQASLCYFSLWSPIYCFLCFWGIAFDETHAITLMLGSPLRRQTVCRADRGQINAMLLPKLVLLGFTSK